MENSHSKHRSSKTAATPDLPAEEPTTIKQEPFEGVSHEQAYASGAGMSQEASTSNCDVQNHLPDEVGETGIQCEDTFSTIEEDDVKAENMSTDDNEENEDDGDMVGTNIKRTNPNDDTEAGNRATVRKKQRLSHSIDNSRTQTAAKPIARRQNISIEKKREIVQLYLDQHRITDIGNIMQLNTQTVSRIVHSYLKHWEVVDNSHRKGGPHLKKLNDEQIQTMKSWVDKECSLSLKKIAEKCREEFGVQVGLSTVRNYLTGFSYTIKRVPPLPERCNRDSQTVEARKQYAVRFSALQAELNDTGFVFLNVAGFHVSLRNSGKPAAQVVSPFRERYIAICCCMSRTGLVAYASSDGVLDQRSFDEFLVQLKAAFRRRNIMKPILFMDSAACKQTASVRTFAEQNNIRLENLPPNAPCLNPTENMFSELKNIVERARPQNETEVLKAIKDGANLVTKQDCDGYYGDMLRHVQQCCDEDKNKE
ncbi:uncharacterized protein LOC118509668 isoform X3 [Anopheles stephensi]|uniref:uncharacterized protein LOC118509668 isoform X3 n=1 Tax=Anopheles stephensi TaxID=30069 RepID=UPI00165875D7|nr:uncharacterized protein LOC118509668 isoform X3 [Anopheles stephensi]